MTDPKTTLRCLAVRQPYGWALAVGAKDIENRTWSTDHRGMFVIQASTAKQEVNRTAKELGGKKARSPSFAYGALIGVGDLVDVVPLSAALEGNPWAYGPYCFRVANARLFEQPIAAKGKLNLYHLDERLDAEVRERLPGARPATLDETDRSWLAAMHAKPIRQRDVHLGSYLELGAWADVARIGSALIAENESDARGWGLRGVGRSLQDLSELELPALADLDRAVELAGDEGAYWLMSRGQLHHDLGNEPQSEADLARARELDPSVFDSVPAASDGEEQDPAPEP